MKTNIGAEFAGGEQGLDGGAKAHDVEQGASRETLQSHDHALLRKCKRISRMETKLAYITYFPNVAALSHTY